jgi:hypothetical protein
LKRFSYFQSASGNGPVAAQGFSTAANQQGAPVCNDDTADANNRPFWILARHPLFSFTQVVGLNWIPAGMVGVDFPRPGI